MRSAGPATVLVMPGAAGSPGVAVMRQEVSRAEYAQFASSTGRPNAQCRNRLALIAMKKRTWVAPGFTQTGDHPAVCVSFADASAYAEWLSQRTGETLSPAHGQPNGVRSPVTRAAATLARMVGSTAARTEPCQSAKVPQARWGSTACAATPANG